MTKKEITEIEKLLSDYSFLEMFASNKEEWADCQKNFAKQLAINSLLLRIGYRVRVDRKEEKEGVTYNHFKVEKWS